MNKQDYNLEVMRQLNDENVFFPSSEFHFESAMENLKHIVKSKSDLFPKEINLCSLLNNKYKPCKFYILPKVHKQFDRIPPGRPICSSIGTLNSPFSKLLDCILQPVMNFVPDLILDTNHLLLLLNDIHLDPSKEYILLTADIVSLYTEFRDLETSSNPFASDGINKLSNSELQRPVSLLLHQAGFDYIKIILHFTKNSYNE